MTPQPVQKRKSISIDEILSSEPTIAPSGTAPSQQLAPVGSKPKSVGFDQMFGLPEQTQVSPQAAQAFSQEEAQGQSELGRAFRQYALPGAAMLGAGFLSGGAPLWISGAAGAAGMLNRGLDIKDEGGSLTSPESLADIGLTGAKDAATAGVMGKLMKAIPYQGRPVTDAMWRALMGATAGTALRKGEEAVAGTPPDPNATMGGGYVDFAKDFGLNLGVDLLTRGLVKGGNRLINGKVVTPEPTGQTLKQGADELRTELARSGLVGPQTEKQASVVTKPHSQAAYGRGVEKVVRAGKNVSESNESKYFNFFRDEHAKPNSADFEGITSYNIEDDGTGHQRIVPTGTKPIRVEGAIMTPDTTITAVEALKQVDQWMSGETFAQLPTEMKPKYIEIRSALKKLADGQTVLDNGEVKKVPIIDWETAKEIRTQINAGSGSKTFKDYPDKLFGDINESLRKDIEYSIKNTWQNGPEAFKALEMANRATELQKETYNRKVLNRISGPNDVTGSKDYRRDPDPEKVLKGSYTDPSEARRLVEAVGPENRHLLSRGYFDGHLMKKAFGDNYSKFNPDFIINEMEGMDSVAREYMTAAERNNILRFARAAKASGYISEEGTPEEQGRARAINFVKDRAVIHISTGLGRLLGIPGLGAGARIAMGTKEMMEGVKDSKPIADIASRLIKIDPNTAEAQSGLKLLLKGLQGVPVIVLDKDGKEERKFVLGQQPRR